MNSSPNSTTIPRELKISVVVTTHNSEATLAESLDSVFAQTLVPAEVLVVDDGSNDSSAAIANSFGPIVRFMPQTKQGNAGTRNIGVENATGDLVAFLDDDDLWTPDKLLLQASTHAAKPHLDFTITHFRYFKAASDSFPKSRDSAYWERSHAGWIPSALMLRKASFQRIGRFDPSLVIGNDADFFFRAIDSGARWESLAETLLLKRMRPGSESTKVDQVQSELLRLVAASIARKKGRASRHV